uniref:Putative secreted protein n=1 Tax=Anopheles darlingi TaxID=43151 RepID=A0A2M4DQY0_ANODA
MQRLLTRRWRNALLLLALLLLSLVTLLRRTAHVRLHNRSWRRNGTTLGRTVIAHDKSGRIDVSITTVRRAVVTIDASLHLL